MALQGVDPNIKHIVRICDNENSANEFAIANGLLPNIPGAGQLGNRPVCPKPNCDGGLYRTVVKGYSHYARCSKCKSTLSLKGGRNGLGGQGNGTWFARIDVLNRPNVKLSTDKILFIIYFWAKDIGIEACHELMGDLIGSVSNHALVDWRNYIRELLLNQLRAAAPMGGPNEIVEIDESYFAGRRKPAANRRGRLLQGNQLGPRRQNYGNRIRGPWVFGMVHKRANDLVDRRFFIVARRDAATLIPIIRRHILPGTTIRSDEWAAYNNLGNIGYVHQTVNHMDFFVDPITGCNTQRIESCWGAAKNKIMHTFRGTTLDLLPGHLAEFWWRGLNPVHRFCRIIADIATAYPQ